MKIKVWKLKPSGGEKETCCLLDKKTSNLDAYIAQGMYNKL